MPPQDRAGSTVMLAKVSCITVVGLMLVTMIYVVVTVITQYGSIGV